MLASLRGLLAACFLTSLSTSSLCAEEKKAERNYQIEVIIFERTSKVGAQDPEAWPKNLDLEYPINKQTILDASEGGIPAEESLTSGNTTAQAVPREITLAFQVNQTSSASDVLFTADSIGTNANLINIDDKLTTATVDAQAQLQYLDDSHRQLTKKRQALDRTRGLRTVFHEAWVQALLPPNDAPALVIKGGNKFGGHYELEGTIRLSVNRYLHMQTNLWLTSFVPNYGQASEHWPSLPSLEPSALWTSPEILLGNIEQTTPSTRLNFTGLDSRASINTAYQFNDEQPPHTIEHEAPFLIKEIVTLQQTRKMRSKELHYIDHPRMGVIVKIIPYIPTEETEVL